MATVALLAEGVGRNNHNPGKSLCHLRVALLAEGVGRNLAFLSGFAYKSQVALLAEGVGRNPPPHPSTMQGRLSPSSRRAWVEITVALLEIYCRDCRPPRGGRG